MVFWCFCFQIHVWDYHLQSEKVFSAGLEATNYSWLTIVHTMTGFSSCFIASYGPAKIGGSRGCFIPGFPTALTAQVDWHLVARRCPEMVEDLRGRWQGYHLGYPDISWDPGSLQLSFSPFPKKVKHRSSQWFQPQKRHWATVPKPIFFQGIKRMFLGKASYHNWIQLDSENWSIWWF